MKPSLALTEQADDANPNSANVSMPGAGVMAGTRAQTG